MGGGISETILVDIHESWQQGDIIQILNGARAGDGPSMGVIINADCDLAHCKTDGIISYIPIYSLKEFISIFWIDGFLKGFVNQNIEQAFNSIDQSTYCETFNDIDRESLVSWVLEDGVDAVCARIFKSYTGSNYKKIKKNLEAILISCSDEDNLLKLKKISKLNDNPHSFIKKNIELAMKSLGEGNFFISEIVGQGGIGFVIRMKRVYAMSDAACYRTLSADASNNVTKLCAVRIARLSPVYKFKILQQFAIQFSRIGLPDEITSLSKLALEDLALSLID